MNSCFVSLPLRTLDVGGCYIGDDAVHEIGWGDCANVTREGRQVRVAGVVEYVVFRGYNWERSERYGHLEPAWIFQSWRKPRQP